MERIKKKKEDTADPTNSFVPTLYRRHFVDYKIK